MQKTVWIKAIEGAWEDKKARITTGMESGVDIILASGSDVELIKSLGKIQVATPGKDGDIEVVGYDGEGDGTLPFPYDVEKSKDLNIIQNSEKKTAAYVKIYSKEYEEFATFLGRHADYLLMTGVDWKIIPFENIIADLQGVEVGLIAEVTSLEDAELAIEILETGVDGVLIDTDDVNEIKKITQAVKDVGKLKFDLKAGTITALSNVGLGDRVCVDTCSLMEIGEGMLVGSTSQGFLLIHSESEESEYVASRPFRVNAGAVHSYIKIGNKTKYLSELKSGDMVSIVDSRDGSVSDSVVGRVKIESRPMTYIEAKYEGRVASAILQNAETIKLVTKEGKPVSITNLKEGDEILLHIDEGARHFGMKIEETIIEK